MSGKHKRRWANKKKFREQTKAKKKAKESEIPMTHIFPGDNDDGFEGYGNGGYWNGGASSGPRKYPSLADGVESVKYPEERLCFGIPDDITLEDLFMRLCAFTTPYGSEYMWWHLFPRDSFFDEKGNIHVYVPEPDGSEPITQFCSHLDTACTLVEPVTLLKRGDIIHTDGKTILGADCKIGVAIMLKMIQKKVPGEYIFHVGEERGCKGAEWLSKNPKCCYIEKPKISIEFDRHSYGSIITFQRGERCCSQAFSDALAAQLVMPEQYPKFQSDDGGLYTDNHCYMELIPEVTNLSVGYHGHHSHKEVQDIAYAQHLLDALLKVNWNILPIARDPSVKESKRASWSGNSGSYCTTYPMRSGRKHGNSVFFQFYWNETESVSSKYHFYSDNADWKIPNNVDVYAMSTEEFDRFANKCKAIARYKKDGTALPKDGSSDNQGNTFRAGTSDDPCVTRYKKAVNLLSVLPDAEEIDLIQYVIVQCPDCGAIKEFKNVNNKLSLATATFECFCDKCDRPLIQEFEQEWRDLIKLRDSRKEAGVNG